MLDRSKWRRTGGRAVMFLDVVVGMVMVMFVLLSVMRGIIMVIGDSRCSCVIFDADVVVIIGV